MYPDREFDGSLTAINSEIAPVTRNIRLQGTLQNTDGALRPGMFARVILTLGEAEEVVRLPATALLAESENDAGEHAGPQRAIRILQRALEADVARHRIDLRVDRGQRAVELATRINIGEKF
ncbi:MAG: efflux RND transporter periplasmic adaptor subunit [Chthoniobacterales bacterium]